MDAYEKYYLSAVYFLKFRPRSVKEVRDNLVKKNAPPEVIEKVINSLVKQKFLNDEEFARSWVESRAKFRPKGKRLVKLELQQKGIDKEIIEKVLAEKPEADDVPDEKSQIKRLVEQRIKKYEGLPRFEIYQKLGAFLARRGFDWDDSKRVIDEILENEYN